MPPNEPVDWDKDEDIIVPRQQPIRVYENAHGNVVICQESFVSDEEDPFIVIRPEYVPDVIAALTRMIRATPKGST